jgi:phosphotriesterase-related protein
MATINSVLGPIDTSELGFTLTHEHITISAAGSKQTYPELQNLERVQEVAVEQLIRAHNEGVATIVDCTTMDLGRDITLMEAVSRRSGVQIICSTGSHLYIPHDFFNAMFDFIVPMSPDDVASLWVREIEEGIEGTGIKAGIIKVATNDPIREPEELMLRAAARTHQRTGVLITTHTPPESRVGDVQIRILEEEGVDLSKVYIGHVNSTLDFDYHKRMIEKGVWLGMDHFFPAGTPSTPGWEDRTTFIKDLVFDGYEDRIMLSHDWNVKSLAFADTSGTSEPYTDGFLWITRSILPLLQELGVSEGAINKLMVENPRRFFEGTGQ